MLVLYFSDGSNLMQIYAELVGKKGFTRPKYYGIRVRVGNASSPGS